MSRSDHSRPLRFILPRPFVGLSLSTCFKIELSRLSRRLRAVMGWNHETPVVFAGERTGYAWFGVEQGIAVAVKDADGFLHYCMHIDQVLTTVGEGVLAVEAIVGLQGNTAALTKGAHLHYEVRQQVTPTWGLGTDVGPGVYPEQVLERQPSPWAKDAKNWAVARGPPYSCVIREEVWAMLYRALQS